eukprot:gene9523-13495_t
MSSFFLVACIIARAASSGVGVHFEACRTSSAELQRWVVSDRDGIGRIQLQRHTGSSSGSSSALCLALEKGGPPQNWAPLVLAPCTSSDRKQQWRYTAGARPVLQYAGYKNANGNAMCIQIDGENPWLGSPAGLWPCSAAGEWPEIVRLVPSIPAIPTDVLSESKLVRTRSEQQQQQQQYRQTGGATRALESYQLQWNMSQGKAPSPATRCLSFTPGPPPPAPPPPLPIPSQQQLHWKSLELGALIQFNIGEFSEQQNDYACSNTKMPPPNAKEFAPMSLNATEWMRAIKSYGGKYAVLTAQAGCGFTLWPSNVALPDGTRYNYTVRESSRPIDLVEEFVTAARAAGITPGIYYIINNNYYLSVSNGVAVPLEELWTKYGTLLELWFDGGIQTPGLQDKVLALIVTSASAGAKTAPSAAPDPKSRLPFEVLQHGS